MRPGLLLTLCACSLLALTACGQTEPTAARKPRLQPLAAEPQPLPQRPVNPAAEQMVRQMVANAVQRLDAIKTLEGKVRFEEWKDGKHDLGTAKVTFRQRPFAARVDVVESNRLLASGTVVLWNGGTQIEVKPLKLPFTVKFDYDDSQVVSLRGYRMDQTDLFSMGKVLRHPQARISPVGPRRVNGEEVFMLEVHSPGSVDDVDRELIGIHQRHGIPTYREMYFQGKLVHKGQGLSLRFDHDIDDEKFDL